MRLARLYAAGALAGMLGLAACHGDRAPTDPSTDNTLSLAIAKASGPKTYIITTKNDQLPATLDADVQARGGKVAKRLAQIGVAVVRSDDPAFKAKAQGIGGVDEVAEDRVVQWVDPKLKVRELSDDAVSAEGTPLVAGDRFFPTQWAPKAIQAPEAWALGYTGKGARVAILDGGIWDQHVDIAPNLDVAHSTSFALDASDNIIPFNQDVGTFWHGTHVAGIVAGAANELGVVGIAPNATLIGVKVLHNGTGSFDAVLNGIIYAATPIAQGGAGADIINMSLGAVLPRQDPDVAVLVKAMDRATRYANKMGVTVIASAGNDAYNFDVMKDSIDLPAMSAQVISVSALGPLGYALGESNFDRPASYTNFGKSIVTLAAPGGDFALPGDDICVATVNGSPSSILQFCWALDMVVSACRGTTTRNVCWSAGTSMAAPAVSGVAALITGKYGHLPPAQIEAKLWQSANDLGKPGYDIIYGHGRVNALRAVM